MGDKMLKILERYPDMISLLSAHDIMPTQQRVQIAHLLFAKAQHLSAEQILERVNDDRSMVSKATVYNTLNLFARKGLVREVIIDPTKVFYDSNTELHHHFYNVDSGMLEDIDATSVALSQIPNPPAGTYMEGVEVIVRVRNSV